VLDLKQWLIVLGPVVALLSLLPNVTAICKLVPLAVASVFVLCVIIIVKSMLDGQEWHEWPKIDEAELHKKWPETPSGLGIVVATLFGAFGVNGNVPSVLCEMKKPEEFPFAFKTAMSVVMIIYMLVMACGYYGYGEFIQDDIIKSLTSLPANANEAFNVPADEWTGPKSHALEYVVSGLLLVKLLIALPLNLIVVFYSFQTCELTKDYVPLGSCANKVMRITVVFIALLLAYSVNDFNQLFSLVASVCGPLLQCVFPLLFSFLVRRHTGAQMTSWRRRLAHLMIVLLGVFSITIGFYESLDDIIKA